jgi:hypothetical protein
VHHYTSSNGISALSVYKLYIWWIRFIHNILVRKKYLEHANISFVINICFPTYVFFICRIALVLAFLMKLASGNYLYGNTFSLSLVSCCLVLANTFSTIFSNFISYYDYISAPFA